MMAKRAAKFDLERVSWVEWRVALKRCGIGKKKDGNYYYSEGDGAPTTKNGEDSEKYNEKSGKREFN